MKQSTGLIISALLVGLAACGSPAPAPKSAPKTEQAAATPESLPTFKNLLRKLALHGGTIFASEINGDVASLPCPETEFAFPQPTEDMILAIATADQVAIEVAIKTRVGTTIYRGLTSADPKHAGSKISGTQTNPDGEVVQIEGMPVQFIIPANSTWVEGSLRVSNTDNPYGNPDTQTTVTFTKSPTGANTADMQVLDAN